MCHCGNSHAQPDAKDTEYFKLRTRWVGYRTTKVGLGFAVAYHKVQSKILGKVLLDIRRLRLK